MAVNFNSSLGVGYQHRYFYFVRSCRFKTILFPYMMNLSISYRCPRIIFPTYWNFSILIFLLLHIFCSSFAVLLCLFLILSLILFFIYVLLNKWYKCLQYSPISSPCSLNQLYFIYLIFHFDFTSVYLPSRRSKIDVLCYPLILFISC